MVKHLRRRNAPRPLSVALLALAGGILLVWALAGGDDSRPRGAQRGRQLFRTTFTAKQGLGPLFNARACSTCHRFPSLGGVGRHGLATVSRVGRVAHGSFDAMAGRGGPIARVHAITGCGSGAGIPAGATVVSVRNAPSLFGTGLIDSIPDATIQAGASASGGAHITGRVNLVHGPDGVVRVGRFGWKADVPTLEQFVAQAFRNELGLTSPLAPFDTLPRAAQTCARESAVPEVSASDVADVTAFVASLPEPRPARPDPRGTAVFAATGCASCHRPALRGAAGPVPLYSDLLVHDMGRTLDDHVLQGSATGREWRTAPLWGLGSRTRYLHDGRADTLAAAILAHGGEAGTARGRFRRLPSVDQRLLIEFLQSL